MTPLGLLRNVVAPGSHNLKRKSDNLPQYPINFQYEHSQAFTLSDGVAEGFIYFKATQPF